MSYFDRVAARAALCLAGILLVSGCISCPPVINDGVVQLPCCTSGTANIVRIDTGSAPWAVRIPSLNYSQPALSLPPDTAWATVDSATWVRPPGGTRHPGGVYNYTLPFRVPACASGRTITISGRFAGDNTASAFLDTPAGPPAATPFASQATETRGFLAANITSFSTTIASAVPGNYILRFEVENEASSFPPDSGRAVSGGPGTGIPIPRETDTGLAVSGVIATNCFSPRS